MEADVRRPWIAWALAGGIMYTPVITLAQSSGSAVKLWNGTNVPLTFSSGTGAESSSTELGPDAHTLLACDRSLHVSITTGQRVYATQLACGQSYGLYYDGQKFAIRPVPLAGAVEDDNTALAVPVTPDPGSDASVGLQQRGSAPQQQSPWQQLLLNRDIAAENRAANQNAAGLLPGSSSGM
jgi:hypothetical protein